MLKRIVSNQHYSKCKKNAAATVAVAVTASASAAEQKNPTSHFHKDSFGLK